MDSLEIIGKYLSSVPLSQVLLVLNYDPEQERVPAGQAGGGKWTTGGGHQTYGAGTSEPNYPKTFSGKEVKPGSAKDLAHDPTDWHVGGDWKPLGAGGVAHIKIDDVQHPDQIHELRSSLAALPESWGNYLRRGLSEVKGKNPNEPGATYMYGSDQKTIWANVPGLPGTVHDIQFVHEVGHALDSASGWKMSELDGVKGVRLTKYVEGVAKQVKQGDYNFGNAHHESFAEAVAMYSYPKGRAYLQNKYPKTYAVMHKLFTEGPEALLGGRPPVPSQSRPQTAEMTHTPPPRSAKTGVGKSGDKVDYFSLHDVNAAAGTAKYKSPSGEVLKVVKKRKSGGKPHETGWYIER